MYHCEALWWEFFIKMPDFKQFFIHLKSHFKFHSLLKARWCTILMQYTNRSKKLVANLRKGPDTWHEAMGELSTDLICSDNPQSFLYMQHQNKYFSLYLSQSLSTPSPPPTSFSDYISMEKHKQNCQSNLGGSMAPAATLSPLRNMK